MGWRTVVIRNPARLNYSGGYLQVIQEKTTRIYLDEIKTLLIESDQTVLTAYLLTELNKREIMTVFCDHRHFPDTILHSLKGTERSSFNYRKQVSWSKERKDDLWRQIVLLKINRQLSFLLSEGLIKEEELPEDIYSVESGDCTNREAVAAKFYFKKLFGEDFQRREETNVNVALNYGYSLLLSAFCREIAAHGYLTHFGIHHSNVYNQDNFGCDLMEPFRILVDRKVKQMEFDDFGPDQKKELISFMYEKVDYDDRQEPIYQAISLFCENALNFMEGMAQDLICYEL